MEEEFETDEDFQQRLDDFVNDKHELYSRHDPVYQLRTYLDLLTTAYVLRREKLYYNQEFRESVEAIELQLSELWIELTPLFGRERFKDL